MGKAADIERALPPGLSEERRLALAQFFAGQLSAGELSQRLSFDCAAAGEPRVERVPASPEPTPAPRRVRLMALRAWLTGAGRTVDHVSSAAPPR